MSLASVFSRFVPADVQRRGEAYLREGRVRLAACNESKVKGRVTGTEEYDVTLVREGGLVWASCECPFFLDRMDVCKHLWATLLAADGKGALRGPRGGLPNEIIAIDALDDEDDWIKPLARPAAAPPPAAPPPPPGWREVLAPLARETALPPGRADEVLFVLDLPASEKRQGLVLDLLTFSRKKDGSRGALRPLRMNRGDADQHRDPRLREVFALLTGAMQGDLYTSWSYSRYQDLPRQPWIPDVLAREVAERLCATGRFHLRPRSGEVEDSPLTWDDGPSWELWLAVREEADGASTVVPELRRGADRLPAKEAVLLAAAGLLLTAGRVIAPLDTGGAAAWLSLFDRKEPLLVPAEEREDLLETLFAAPVLPRLDLPPSLSCAETTVAPQPRLRLLPPPAGRFSTNGTWPLARVAYLYEGHEVSAGSRARGVYERAERRFLLRDVQAEERAFAALAPLGFRPGATDSSGEPTFRIPPKRVTQAVRTLLGEGWSVEAQGTLYRSPGRFEMRVASGVDWFELHGDVEFAGETVGLPRLLAALKRGDGFVPLSDGGLGLLPEEWLERWAPLAGLGKADGDHLRFSSAQALLLDAWLAEEPSVSCDATFARARERLRSFAGIAPADPPSGFHGTLRPYQRAGLGWLHFLRELGLGGCLADDMGLGKTVQILALLAGRREQRAAESLPPSLVVVPRSLVFNWLSEAARFAPDLQILDYTGAGRAEEGEAFADHDVVLTTYGTLRRDIAVLRERELDYVILDEAQAIKTAGSQTAQAARLLHARHRLSLSGTPVENHLGEIWSLLEFLNPGFTGSEAFRRRAGDLRAPGAASPELARALRPLILRRTKQQVAPELPDRVEQTLICELPPWQHRLYDELRR